LELQNIGKVQLYLAIDILGKVRAGKIMFTIGKRGTVKEATTLIGYKL
jgi:hypothetical protein